MIDTVVLVFDRSEFSIRESAYDSFTPSARGFLKRPFYLMGGGFMKCVLNPTKEDEKRGEYMPRLTLYKAVRSGGYSIFLHIEFSVPKILFNNNFDELTDGNFEEVCSKLSKKLFNLGITIFPHKIQEAQVKAIHYGKNIVLDDYTTASSVITQISKVNVPKTKNIANKTFDNDGEAIYFFTSQKGFIAYDKIRELEKAKRTSKSLKENDYYCQLSLLDDKRLKHPFEMLRIESRYLNKKSIRSVMDQCSIHLPDNPTFKDYFSVDIARNILLFEFEEIKNRYLGFDKSKAKTIEDFAVDLRKQNPDITPTLLYKAIVFKALTNETGSRDIRNILGVTSSQWSRLTKDLSSLEFRKLSNDGLDTVYDQLNSFSTVRLSDYELNIKGGAIN